MNRFKAISIKFLILREDNLLKDKKTAITKDIYNKYYIKSKNENLSL